MNLNLPSTDLEETLHKDKITIYDPFSAERTLQVQWKKCSLQSWIFGFSCEDAEEISFNNSTNPFPFKFDTNGDSESPFDQILIKWKPNVSSVLSTISLKESVITAKGEEFSFSNTQDGKSSGKFKSLKYLFDGQVIGEYGKGYKKTIGTLALIDSY
jgi:flagellar hook protein FlgE